MMKMMLVVELLMRCRMVVGSAVGEHGKQLTVAELHLRERGESGYELSILLMVILLLLLLVMMMLMMHVLIWLWLMVEYVVTTDRVEGGGESDSVTASTRRGECCELSGCQKRGGRCRGRAARWLMHHGERYLSQDEVVLAVEQELVFKMLRRVKIFTGWFAACAFALFW